MGISIRNKNGYSIIDVSNDLVLSSLVEYKMQVDKLLKNKIKYICFNLAECNHVDSGSLRMLINLSKRLVGEGGKLAFTNLTQSAKNIFDSNNLSKVFDIYITENDIPNVAGEKSGFDFWENAQESSSIIRKVNLGCEICGEHNVYGYLLSPKHRKRVWDENSFLPVYEGVNNEDDTDFNRVQVAVCPDCLMSSISLNDFNVINDDGKIINKSVINEIEKNNLSKGISKRKKIMEIGTVVGDTFFELPRSDSAVVVSYLLASECLRDRVSDRSKIDPFMISYMNIMAGEYAPKEEEMLHFESARVWLGEMENKFDRYSSSNIAEGLYYLFVSCLRSGKNKDAEQALNKLKQLYGKLSGSSESKLVIFWFERANQIWDKIGKENT